MRNIRRNLAPVRQVVKRALFNILILSSLTISLATSGQAAQQLPSASTAWQSKVDEWVLNAAQSGEVEFIVFLSAQADLSEAEKLTSKLDKGRFVYQELVDTAHRTQPELLAALEAQGLTYQAYWVANMVWVRGNQQVIQDLALRTDVDHIFANPAVQADLPSPVVSSLGMHSPQAIEWNLIKVNAPLVWQAGFTGQGVVIGGQDTGYDWQHPALKTQYRGWDGVTANHNYSWHDSIHTLDPHNSGENPCGLDSQVPCDDESHGTHTMGIMVGDDDYDNTFGDGNNIGMAPGARWIGCRNMERGWGKPSTYAECYQWFLAPTDLAGQDPDPAMAPDVINNSWSCPPQEGCNDPGMLETVVHNVTAAGILTVHAAGNSGPNCSTINTPAAIYSDSFTVANTTIQDALSISSSRGPVTVDGSNRRKPDIAAPGTSIYSSIPGGLYGYKSGTSMAAPHVAGLAALLISARPELSGQLSYLRQIIERSSNPNVIVSEFYPQTCGEISKATIPNNHFGWGRVDAARATDAALAQVVKQAQAVATVGEVITYTLTVTNLHPSDTFHGFKLRDTLPFGTQFIRAAEPYTRTADILSWDWLMLGSGESQQVWVAVQLPSNPGVVTNQAYGWQSDEFGEILGLPVQTLVRYHWVYIFPLIFKNWAP